MLVRSLAVSLLIAMLAVPAARAAETAPVVIPVITSLTGPGAFIGKEEQQTLQGLESAVNRAGGIKGAPVRFEFYDDQAKPQVAVQLFNDVTAKGAQVVIGPSVTNTCLAVEPLVKTRIVDYCLSPGVDPARGSYVFADSVSGPDIFSAMVHYFHRMRWDRIGTLTTADATGQQADQRVGGAVAAPENKGVTVVDQEHFAPSDLTVAAQVARLKAARPSVLVAWVIGTPFVTALRGLSEAGFDVPVLASNSNMIYDQLRQWGPLLPPELLFSGPAFLAGVSTRAQRPVVDQFLAVAKDAGVTPDFTLAIPWDPALIIISALRKLGPSASAEQIHGYIEGLRGFAGLLGTYDFTSGNQRGLTQRDLTIIRWDAKKSAFVAVSKPGGDPL